MKKTDLQTGVVYAYQRGKYDSIAPAVLVSLDLFQSNLSRYGRDKTGEPSYVPAGDRYTVPGSHFDTTVGYLAISNGSLRYGGGPNDPTSLEALTTITLADVLRDTVQGGEDPQGYVVSLINNRAIVGVYDDVLGAKDAKKQAADALFATQRAEAQALVDEATDRFDRFAALGVAIPVPSVEEFGSYDDSTYTKKVRTENVLRVTLDSSTLDRILSLLEG